MYLKPPNIFYSQNNINSTFGKYTRHSGTDIGETLDDIYYRRIKVESIPTITVAKRDGKWFTQDNRRLWIFHHLEGAGKLDKIRMEVTDEISSRKFTTSNGGVSVSIYRGRDPGGRCRRYITPVTPRVEEPEESAESSSDTPTTSGDNVNVENGTELQQVNGDTDSDLQNKEIETTKQNSVQETEESSVDGAVGTNGEDVKVCEDTDKLADKNPDIKDNEPLSQTSSKLLQDDSPLDATVNETNQPFENNNTSLLDNADRDSQTEIPQIDEGADKVNEVKTNAENQVTNTKNFPRSKAFDSSGAREDENKRQVEDGERIVVYRTDGGARICEEDKPKSESDSHADKQIDRNSSEFQMGDGLNIESQINGTNTDEFKQVIDKAVNEKEERNDDQVNGSKPINKGSLLFQEETSEAEVVENNNSEAMCGTAVPPKRHFEDEPGVKEEPPAKRKDITDTFGKSTPHKNTKIGKPLDDIYEGDTVALKNKQPIEVAKKDGKWFTLDNRRLWIFHHLEGAGKLDKICVEVTDEISSRKFTTSNGGVSVSIYRGRDPGGRCRRFITPVTPRVEDAEQSAESSSDTPTTSGDNVNAENGTGQQVVNGDTGLSTDPIDLHNKAINTTIQNDDVAAANVKMKASRKRSFEDDHGVNDQTQRRRSKRIMEMNARKHWEN